MAKLSLAVSASSEAGRGDYLRAEETPQPLASIPKEATTISHVSCALLPLNRSDSEPKKQAAPTTQIALEGTSVFTSCEAFEVNGLRLRTRKSTKSRTQNTVSPVLRDPSCISQNTPRRVGALTMKAIRSLVGAASVFVMKECQALLGCYDAAAICPVV